MASKAELAAYRALGKFEDRLTELHYRFWKPIFDRREGVDIVLTKTPEEREFLTEMFIKIREQGEVKEILFAAGGDDGDLDEFAEALLLSGVALSDEVVKRVRVTSTPMGPAPEEIRKAWEGVEFIAMKLPDLDVPEVDFVSGEEYPRRETYTVYAPYVIAKLRETSPEAADWFTQNLPKDLRMLSFGTDEVEVIIPVQYPEN